MTREDWITLAVTVSTAPPEELEILKERGDDVRIARIQSPEGRSVVVKCWNRKGLKGTLRRKTKSNIGYREYEALDRLFRAGTPCPEPLAYMELPISKAAHTEALISADLGVCADSTEVFKGLLRDSPEDAAVFEEELIRSTCSMVKSGLLDTDHRLPNYVVPPSGGPIRIDFELCTPVKNPGRYPKRLGIMLGTFLGSMVFAVQPHTERADLFAKRLFAELKPSAKVVAIAQETLDQMMKRQKQESGIDSSLKLEVPA